MPPAREEALLAGHLQRVFLPDGFYFTPLDWSKGNGTSGSPNPTQSTSLSLWSLGVPVQALSSPKFLNLTDNTLIACIDKGYHHKDQPSGSFFATIVHIGVGLRQAVQ